MRLRYWLTCIFLCTAFSVEAQNLDSLRLEAVSFEREYFLSENPSRAEMALVDKANCLMQMGETKEAEKTLQRIAMHLLTPSERDSVEVLLSQLQSSGAEVKTHSAVWAFVPPVGHIMVGETGRGLALAALDVGALTFGVCQIASGQWLTGYLCGGVTLLVSYFYEGGRLVPLLQGNIPKNE